MGRDTGVDGSKKRTNKGKQDGCKEKVLELMLTVRAAKIFLRNTNWTTTRFRKSLYSRLCTQKTETLMVITQLLYQFYIRATNIYTCQSINFSHIISSFFFPSFISFVKQVSLLMCHKKYGCCPNSCESKSLLVLLIPVNHSQLGLVQLAPTNYLEWWVTFSLCTAAKWDGLI